MKILISGGTGFIGNALCKYFNDAGYELIIISRGASAPLSWIRMIKRLDEISSSEKIDIAINLAGEPVANKKWTPKQKAQIVDSRLTITDDFVEFFQRAENKPELFISSSAIGYYGIEADDTPIGEDSVGDNSFSSELCKKWEASASKAELLGIRTCILRIGIVLGKSGGALAKMVPAFKMGVGGKMGSGSQWMPWIHLDDIVGIINHCIADERLNGPINCTAPKPATNLEFTKTLGKLLRRPTFMSMPAPVLSLLMGEMGRELLLAGKKVVPTKVIQTEYKFKFSELESALSNVLN